MKKKKKLSKEERLEIGILLSRRYSLREIARALGRSPNTISREIRLNRVNGKYDPKKAHHKAYVRKKYSRFQWKKINEDKELKQFIIECLKKHWNPEEIAGYMRRKGLPFYGSRNSIYRWLYSTKGVPYCRYLYSRRYTRKRRVRRVKRVIILNRVGVERRYRSANNRSWYGHLEADTVVSGRRGRGALLVSVDRKSRYVELRKLGSMRPRETGDKLKDMIRNRKIKSITFDNGIENRYHYRLGISTFFCDPYSSWQKGSVENVNRMVRRYLPKGTNISKVGEEYVQYIQDTINKKPRAILGFCSAHSIMLEKGLIKSGVS